MFFGYLEINVMNSKRYVDKGIYKGYLIVRIKNMDTGKMKTAYSNNGFVTFYNLDPSTYTVMRWKLKGKTRTKSFYFYGAVRPEISFEIKPQTVTMINKIRVNFKIGGKYGWLAERVDFDTKKSEMEKEFRENPKNVLWQNYKLEFISLKTGN